MHYNFTVTSLRAKNLLSSLIKGKESFAFAKEIKFFPCSQLTSSDLHYPVGLQRKPFKKMQLCSYEQELRYNGFQLLSV